MDVMGGGKQQTSLIIVGVNSFILNICAWRRSSHAQMCKPLDSLLWSSSSDLPHKLLSQINLSAFPVVPTKAAEDD